METQKTEAPADAGITAALVKEAAAAAVKEILATTKMTNNAAGLLSAGASNDDQAPANDDRPVTSGQKSNLPPGINFARMVKAKSVAEMKRTSPVEVVKDWSKRDSSYQPLVKAFSAALLTDGGALINEQVSNEFIEYYRPITTVVKDVRRVPMANGNLTMNRQTGTSTTGYVGEAVAPTPTKPALDQLRFSSKKLMGLVAISNDLIKTASIDAEQFVLQDLAESMALTADLAILTGAGTQYTPRGIYNQVTASTQRFTATVVSAKVPTLAEVRNEFAKLKYKVEIQNTPRRNPHIYMGIRTRYYLETMADSLGNDPVFLRELSQGRIWGTPFTASNQIVDNTGGASDESCIYYVEMSDAILAEEHGLEVLVDPNGTYDDSGTLRSGLSRDETVIRVLEKHDFNLRKPTSAAIVTAVRWGAP